jgi:cation:H+ antiporter
MELVPVISFFLIGFVLLVASASILVSGARSIAHILGIPVWFTGLVIVGIGTSVPELSITVAAALQGSALGIGTIIGSNTFNILGIIGISALLAPITLRKAWVYRDLAFNMAAILAAAGMIFLPFLGDTSFLGITRPEALVLLALFACWLIFMYLRSGKEDDGAEYRIYSGLTSVLFVAVGILGVFFGGKWVVSGAETLALALGVSPALVALTILGPGTSLPELTVSTIAFLRGHRTLAVGNIIGSNIFDFLGILGIAGTIAPLAVSPEAQFDIAAAFAAAFILFYLARRRRNGEVRYIISRATGAALVVAYAAYLLLVFLRG